MLPEERFGKFVREMSNEPPVPLRYLTRDQQCGGFSNQRLFVDNWRRYEEQMAIAMRMGDFRRILYDALDVGHGRKPKQHDVAVHVDWLLDYIDGDPLANRTIHAIADHLQNVDEPIFLTAPHRTRSQTSAFDVARKAQFSEARSVSTITRPNFTGLMDLNGLERFFSLTRGYHPEDTFRLHGGEWHACLTTAALQLMSATIGRWFAYPGEGVLEQQRAVIAVAANMDATPVRFGHAYDGMFALRQFEAVCASQMYRVSLKFNDGKTQIYEPTDEDKLAVTSCTYGFDFSVDGL